MHKSVIFWFGKILRLEIKLWQLKSMGIWGSKYLIKAPESFWKGIGNRWSNNNGTVWNASSEEEQMEEEEWSEGLGDCLPSWNLQEKKTPLSISFTLPDITPTVSLCLYSQLKDLPWESSTSHRSSSPRFQMLYPKHEHLINLAWVGGCASGGFLFLNWNSSIPNTTNIGNKIQTNNSPVFEFPNFNEHLALGFQF